VLLVGGGVVYKKFLQPKGDAPVNTGVVKEFTIISQKDKWNFNPEVIEVQRGDRVKLTIVNEDSYDHGFALTAYGISQRMPANGTIHVEFVASQLGEFAFICSVPCGEGDVMMDNKKSHRTHFDMVGKIIVKA